ncbi:MAG: helix-turn-helix domain-containing protein [Polyangiaceae bacterium]
METPVELERLYTLPEVAAYTRTSVSTVRYWLSTGKLQSIKPGRLRMVRLSALEQFLGANVAEGARK